MAKTKSKHLANTELEESNTLHKLHKRRRKVDSVASSIDLEANKFSADASVKLKPAKSDELSEGVACRGLDIKSGKKEKMHKKKTTVDKSDVEHVKTVSSLSRKLQKKMLRDTERMQETDEQGAEKFHSNDKNQKIKSMEMEPPCKETSSVFNDKRKCRKKRKRPQDESVHDELATEQSAETVIAGCSAKKVRRDAGEDKTTSVNTEHADNSTAASSSRYHALEYLRSWKSAHGSWSFQKVRQVWLLQHMYDPDMVIITSSTCFVFVF